MTEIPCPENSNCLNGPGGMYHCPYCGAMILPGFPTEGLCLINDREWMDKVNPAMIEPIKVIDQ